MDDLERFGPRMAALTDKQRGYVLAMLSDPLGNPTAWARAAGYSDHMDRCKVSGHHLSHDDRIKEAAREECLRLSDTVGPVLAMGVMFQIARTNGHKDQLKAAEAIANRVGLHETSEHKVSVEHTDKTGAALIERIRQLAGALNIDPAALLGANQPKLIEAVPQKETGLELSTEI